MLVLLAAPLLLSFSIIDSTGEEGIVAGTDSDIYDPFEMEMQTFYLQEISLDTSVPDLQRQMYRNPYSKKIIQEFYTEIAGSAEFARLILSHSEKHGLPYSFVFSLVWNESKFNSRAVNHNSNSIDRGLFQLNSRSFPEIPEHDFYRPEINVSHGAAYLKWCLETGGNEIVALAMYNAGRTKVERNGTPKMTLDYISGILDYQREIEKKFMNSLEKRIKKNEIAFLVN